MYKTSQKGICWFFFFHEEEKLFWKLYKKTKNRMVNIWVKHWVRKKLVIRDYSMIPVLAYVYEYIGTSEDTHVLLLVDGPQCTLPITPESR